MKKLTIRCPYCGSEVQRYEFGLKLRLLYKDNLTYHCRICHHKSVWKEYFVLKHDSLNKEEKIFNHSKLWDDRI